MRGGWCVEAGEVPYGALASGPWDQRNLSHRVSCRLPETVPEVQRRRGPRRFEKRER